VVLTIPRHVHVAIVIQSVMQLTVTSTPRKVHSNPLTAIAAASIVPQSTRDKWIKLALKRSLPHISEGNLDTTTEDSR
jgi:hypothetical protein